MPFSSSQAVILAGQVVADFVGEPVIKVTPILDKGSVNQIFVVKTATASIVVRLNDAETAFQEFEKERWCFEQAAIAGIPGPIVLKVGKAGATAYMLETLVAGENGDDCPLNKLEIWHKLGKYARIIHSIKVTQPFGLEAVAFDNFEIKWSQFLAYNIESLSEADPLIGLGVLTPTQSKQVKQLFASLKERKYQFGLVHRDLAPRNTIRDKSGRVSLLDWGCAEINIVPHTDLTVLLGWQILENYPTMPELEAFLEGYVISMPDFELMRGELEVLLLLRAFDTVRWAIERKPERIEDLAVEAKKILQHLYS